MPSPSHQTPGHGPGARRAVAPKQEESQKRKRPAKPKPATTRHARSDPRPQPLMQMRLDRRKQPRPTSPPPPPHTRHIRPAHRRRTSPTTSRPLRTRPKLPRISLLLTQPAISLPTSHQNPLNCGENSLTKKITGTDRRKRRCGHRGPQDTPLRRPSQRPTRKQRARPTTGRQSLREGHQGPQQGPPRTARRHSENSLRRKISVRPRK